jgi:FOG: HPt domain
VVKGCIDYDEFMQETGIDNDEIRELYGVFMEELLQEKEKLKTQLGVKDYLKLEKTVHNIKGISGSYKARLIFEPAKLIDLDLKGGAYGNIEQNMKVLLDAIDNAVLDMRMHFNI